MIHPNVTPSEASCCPKDDVFDPVRPVRGGRSVYLETFGCQMNELDSELVKGQLRALGYRFTEDAGQADVVLYNTCSVREQAENKVWSRVGINGIQKSKGATFILGVIGCMAEREGAAMLDKFPQIDLLCGPGELDKLPRLIDNAFRTTAVERADRVALQGNNSRRSSTLMATGDNLELLDLSRAFDPDSASAGGRSAYVRITRGCNKFCTYCVVPYTRGAEVHRPPDSIIDECKKLADRGVIEITLLGQTVNHYSYVHGTAVSVGGAELPQIGAVITNGKARPASAGPATQRTTSFAELLRRIHDEVPAIQRLRFVTSYPRDFGDDILQVMAASPRICRYLHAPAQSGSDRILKMMNRGYTAGEYVDFVDRCRGFMPDVCIGGDMIVGFPGETEADHELSRQLLQRVRCKNSFIFKYSPRPGTAAIDRFVDDVPDAVKRRRNRELLDLQNQISESVHADFVGRTLNVLVEQLSHRFARGYVNPHERSASGGRVELGWERAPTATVVKPAIQMSGRTDGDLIAVFDLPEGSNPDSLIGQVIPIEMTGAGPLVLQGRVASERLAEAAGKARKPLESRQL